MGYLEKVVEAIEQDGIDLDVTENVIAGGVPGQTISIRAANAEKEGRVWGCVFCSFLNVVQWHHCAKQLAGTPMRWWNYMIALALLIGAPSLMIWALVRLI